MFWAENGSGKTTMGKLMCGLVKTKQGIVKVSGTNIYKRLLARYQNM